MQQLDQITDGMDDKEFKKAVKDNFKLLSSAIAATDLRLLGSYSTTASDATTASTTMVRIQGLQGGFRSNGGLIVVAAVISANNSGANRIDFTMLFDQAVTTYASIGATGAASEAVFFWVGSPQAGNHQIDFQWSVTAGTATLNPNSESTYWYVLEFLKG